MRLDKSQPYGYVFGSIDGYPGAKYFQGGAYFDVKGRAVGATPKNGARYTASIPAEAHIEPSEDDILIGPSAVTVAEAIASTKKPDYTTMHHNKLKKLVQAAGGEYTHKLDAIDFLESLDG